MKKEYIAPAIELFDMEAESMIATSPGVGGDLSGNGDYDGGEWTNKRQPSSPWNSSNWGTEE